MYSSIKRVPVKILEPELKDKIIDYLGFYF